MPVDVVTFTVPGIPQPQGSKTARTRKDGGTYMHEGNRKTLEPWRAAVAWHAAAAMRGRRPLAGPIRLDVLFVFPRPKAHYRTGRHAGELKPSAPARHAVKPDVDKLARALGDALTGVAIVDDAGVAELRAAKHYGSPAAHVTLEALE